MAAYFGPSGPEPIRLPPTIVPARMATKVPHLDHAVAAGDLLGIEMLGQIGVFERAEHRRMQAHQEYADVQQAGGVADETERGQGHDDDFRPSLTRRMSQALSSRSANWPLVAENNKNGAMNNGTDQKARDLFIDPAPFARRVGGEQGEGELEDVVIRRAEELQRGNKGRKRRCVSNWYWLACEPLNGKLLAKALARMVQNWRRPYGSRVRGCGAHPRGSVIRCAACKPSASPLA